jgi:O-antigen/teichoic acid export membrane protein
MDTYKTQPLFNTVAKGSLIVAGSNIVLKIGGIISTVLVLRYLSVYDYGLWRLLLSIITFASIVTLPSLDSVIGADLGRELGKGNIGLYKSIFKKTAIYLIYLGLFAGIILYIGAPIVKTVTKIDLTLFIQVLAFSLIASVILRIYKFVFSTHLKFQYSNGVGVANKVFYIILLLIFFFYFKLGLMAVVLAYTASLYLSAIIFVPFFIKTIKYLRFVKSEEYSVFGMIKQHGKWGMVGSYFDEVTSSVKPWIIGYFTSIETVGIFSAAVALYSEVANFSPLNNVLSSVFPRESNDKNKLIFMTKKSIKYAIWTYIILALGAVVIVPLTVPILIPHYTDSISIFVLLLVSLLLLPLSNICSVILNTFKLQKQLFISSFVSRLSSMIFVLPLSLHLFGVYGAVIDHFVVSAVVTKMRIMFTKKILKNIDFITKDLIQFNEYDSNLISRIFKK